MKTRQIILQRVEVVAIEYEAHHVIIDIKFPLGLTATVGQHEGSCRIVVDKKNDDSRRG